MMAIRAFETANKTRPIFLTGTLVISEADCQGGDFSLQMFEDSKTFLLREPSIFAGLPGQRLLGEGLACFHVGWRCWTPRLRSCWGGTTMPTRF